MRFSLAGLLIFTLAFGAAGFVLRQPREICVPSATMGGEIYFDCSKQWGWPLPFYYSSLEQRPHPFDRSILQRVPDDDQSDMTVVNYDPQIVEPGFRVFNFCVDLLVIVAAATLVSWLVCRIAFRRAKPM